MNIVQTLSFPPLNDTSLSQEPENQAILRRIRDLWEENSTYWDDEVRRTVLSCLKDVRTTKSNRDKPSGHKLWQARDRWNFGHYLVLMFIYPGNLRGIRSVIMDKFAKFDLDNMRQSTPWIRRNSDGPSDLTSEMSSMVVWLACFRSPCSICLTNCYRFPNAQC